LKSQIQTVNDVELGEGEPYAPHAHADSEECFFIIAGEAKAEIAGKHFILRKGNFLVLEAGEQHVFANRSKGTFRYFQFRIRL
jgi:mannose-6-phosphate isomerase-like protein (cupin superfamily)